MKNLLTFIFINFAIFQLFGQQENRFAKEVFQINYKETYYPRFEGNIEIKENAIKYGDKIITFEVDNDRKIFENKLFNPDVVFGKETIKYTKEKIATLNQTQRVLFNLTRNDSLHICCITELNELNPNLKTRRYKFWLFRIGVANPTEYYLELYNYEGRKEMSLDEFSKKQL